MLYSSYREKCWYWSAVVASRKAVIAFITRTTLLEDHSLEIHWIILYFSVSIMANLVAQQYVGAVGISEKDAKSLQLLDATSLFLLLFTAWSGLFFNLSPYCGRDEVFCLLTLGVVFLVNLLFFLYCLFLLRTYIKSGVRMVPCSIYKGKVARRIRRREESIRGIHGNPLVYRRSLVEKQEFKNPLQLFESNAQGIMRLQKPVRLKKQASGDEPILAIEMRSKAQA